MNAWREKAAWRLVRLARRLNGIGVVPEGFVPITHAVAGDIFIVGYPKSGNTWFQDLVAGVVFGVMPEWAPPELVQELVPDVHARPYYRRYATPTFFKSHHLPRPEYRR
ncbi:MAG: hypothetical protein KGS61_20345, partial [Verrucomicrobia bacterium]|nr:hypothetical protein [Verrucomicrobiota bacterium]